MEVDPHQLLKDQDHLAEEVVGDAPHQGLACPVHHKGKVGEPGEGGILPLCEGDDLEPPLLGGPDIVEDRLRTGAMLVPLRPCSWWKIMKS